MKKAALPIPHIIALIMGVIVVAVLAYWFINSGGKGSDIGTEAECTARKAEYCATPTQSLKEWNEAYREKCGLWSNEACVQFCKSIVRNDISKKCQ